MWIKVFYKYDRENNGMSGTDMTRFETESIELAVKKIDKYFSEWNGIGSIDVYNIEGGPFISDEEIIEKNKNLFIKSHTFNNE